MGLKHHFHAVGRGLVAAAKNNENALPEPAQAVLLGLGVWVGLLAGVHFESLADLGRWVGKRSTASAITLAGFAAVLAWANELLGPAAGWVRLLARATALSGAMAAVFTVVTFQVNDDGPRTILRDSTVFWFVISALLAVAFTSIAVAAVWLIRRRFGSRLR